MPHLPGQSAGKTRRIIVAIGGGDIRRTPGTLAIDREIIGLSGKKHPQVLFVPTASSDHEGYIQHFRNHFGKKLGCQTDVLYLIRETPSPAVLAEKILSADIIYVGGGNTLKMMKRWRRLGVDKLLGTAWKRGIVLCGISAGSICWFKSGHSDSMSFYHPKQWQYINVRGLGFLKAIHCPHFDSATLGIPRKKHFMQMIQRTCGVGIAMEDNCAIAFVDDSYRIITSKKSAKAYRVFRRDGRVIAENILQTKQFLSATSLF